MGNLPNFKPHVVAIVQARMGASRFPGKVLEDLHGEPVLKWVLYRIKQAKLVDDIVVATPDKRISDVVSSWGPWGFWWRGDENDVLGRYAAAVYWSNAEVVVRITADCPLVDPQIIDQAVEALKDNDFVSTVLERNREHRWLPKGCEVEVIPGPLLLRMHRKTKDPYEREHVTAFLYKKPRGYRIIDLNTPEPNRLINWCIDTPEDLDRMRMIFHTLDGIENMGYREIVDALLRRSPRDGDRPGGDRANHGPDEGRQEAVPGPEDRKP